MRRGRATIGDTLRAILLSTPFLGAVACGGSSVPGHPGGVVGICSPDEFAWFQMEVPQEGFLLGDCMPYCWPVAGAKTCEIVYGDLVVRRKGGLRSRPTRLAG